MDEDFQTIYQYYTNLERALYFGEGFDAEKIYETNNSEEGALIKNKMLIMACYNETNRQTYLSFFRLFAEHGCDWYNQYNL